MAFGTVPNGRNGRELVPSAEFEITYFRFSRILKEIRPIAGYEYPEGTKELCEKISKMYS
ncbi:MAG: hypothetical protein ACI4PP_05050 [Clostridia bacterium]